MARLHLRIKPAARTTKFDGWFGDVPKVAVAAPPVGGAANEALLKWLAKTCGVPPRQIRLVGGAASRFKRIEIEGMSEHDLEVLIERMNPRPPS